MTKIVKGSISDVANIKGESIATSLMNAKILVLLDVSGSMLAPDAKDGLKRCEVATNELIEIQRDNPGEVFLVCFSDYVEPCIGGYPVHPNGSTDLTLALNYSEITNGTDFKIVVISDGSPNNPQSALNAAKSLTCPIYTIHIGPESDHKGKEFLKRLSSSNGGRNLKSGGVGSLKSGVTFLLTG